MNGLTGNISIQSIFLLVTQSPILDLTDFLNKANKEFIFDFGLSNVNCLSTLYIC